MPELTNIVNNNERIELKLNLNNFNNPEELSGLKAVAQKFMNLIMLKPGTYPDHPKMGVNIEQYLWEILDENICNRIEEHILKQIDEYMPNNGINTIVVRPMEDPTTGITNTLGIAVSISVSGTAVEEFYMFLQREANKEINCALTF